MTDDDIKRIHLEQTGFDLDASEAALLDFARAIERAVRRAALDHCTDVLANVAAHGGDMNAAIGLIRALSEKESGE